MHFEIRTLRTACAGRVEDARSYIENSHEQFDHRFFLLDSHSTASHFSNIRIDNYVYTREAFQRARLLLKPDGLFIVKFQVDNPWIAFRLQRLMQEAFGQNPIQFQTDIGGYDSSGRFFVAGSAERLAKAAADPALGPYLASHGNMPMQAASVTTDDWPYFYQHEPGLPISVILVSVAVYHLWMVSSPNQWGRRPHRSALHVLRCRFHVARSTDRQQNGASFRDHLGCERGGRLGVIVLDRRG